MKRKLLSYILAPSLLLFISIGTLFVTGNKTINVEREQRQTTQTTADGFYDYFNVVRGSKFYIVDTYMEGTTSITKYIDAQFAYDLMGNITFNRGYANWTTTQPNASRSFSVAPGYTNNNLSINASTNNAFNYFGFDPINGSLTFDNRDGSRNTSNWTIKTNGTNAIGFVTTDSNGNELYIDSSAANNPGDNFVYLRAGTNTHYFGIVWEEQDADETTYFTSVLSTPIQVNGVWNYDVEFEFVLDSAWLNQGLRFYFSPFEDMNTLDWGLPNFIELGNLGQGTVDTFTTVINLSQFSSEIKNQDLMPVFKIAPSSILNTSVETVYGKLENAFYRFTVGTITSIEVPTFTVSTVSVDFTLNLVSVNTPSIVEYSIEERNFPDNNRLWIEIPNAVDGANSITINVRPSLSLSIFHLRIDEAPETDNSRYREVNIDKLTTGIDSTLTFANTVFQSQYSWYNVPYVLNQNDGHGVVTYKETYSKLKPINQGQDISIESISNLYNVYPILNIGNSSQTLPFLIQDTTVVNGSVVKKYIASSTAYSSADGSEIVTGPGSLKWVDYPEAGNGFSFMDSTIQNSTALKIKGSRPANEDNNYVNFSNPSSLEFENPFTNPSGDAEFSLSIEVNSTGAVAFKYKNANSNFNNWYISSYDSSTNIGDQTTPINLPKLVQTPHYFNILIPNENPLEINPQIENIIGNNYEMLIESGKFNDELIYEVYVDGVYSQSISLDTGIDSQIENIFVTVDSATQATVTFDWTNQWQNTTFSKNSVIDYRIGEGTPPNSSIPWTRFSATNGTIPQTLILNSLSLNGRYFLQFKTDENPNEITWTTFAFSMVFDQGSISNASASQTGTRELTISYDLVLNSSSNYVYFEINGVWHWHNEAVDGTTNEIVLNVANGNYKIRLTLEGTNRIIDLGEIGVS